MNCPSCGTPEKARVKVCMKCGEAYASEDLLELRQLEFLLEETASWQVQDQIRELYYKKLESLRERLLPKKEIKPELVIEEPAVEPEPKIVPVVEPKPKAYPAPPAEKIPFDQWLLSERNIKIALYSGAVLLVLAGLIFVSVKWSLIPGPGKFAITFMITLLMYLGGYLLYQRPAYKLGGNALLGIASGFFALNFVVLQIYVVGPGGLRNDVMWLIASPVCLLLYMGTAYWTKSDLITYISIAAVVSTVTAAIVVISRPPGFVFMLAYAILMLLFLGLSLALKKTQLAEFTTRPLVWVSQIGMPLLVAVAFAFWTEESGCTYCFHGNPWLAISAVGVGVLFYITTDIQFKKLIARWAAVVLLTIWVSISLIELNFSDSTIAITLMILALAYMGAGLILERRGEQKKGAIPLYALAYTVALFITLMVADDTESLIKVLIGDVMILSFSAYIHDNYSWVYGAAWLFMLPIFLIIDRFVPVLSNQGLLMGVLGINYCAVGYALGRRELKLSAPFLTAAAFLSVATVVMTWHSSLLVSVILAVVAVLYFWGALWIGWQWLLLPSLAALSFAVFAINQYFVGGGYPAIVGSMVISFASAGTVIIIGGKALHQSKAKDWCWPLYIVGVIDLAGAYIFGLFSGEWLAVGLSVVVAILLLVFTWLERSFFSEKSLPSFLTYMGIIAIFIGHFFLLDAVAGREIWDVWPAYTAGLCALFVVVALMMRQPELADVYRTPIRRSGLFLLIIPMAASIIIFDPIIGAVVFGIVGVIYTAEAVIRRVINLAYLGVGAFVIVFWAVMLALEVSELQAFIAPPGIALLAMGWYERAKVDDRLFRLFTILGLILLMGSALIQSLPPDAWVYALILLIESLAALAWGIKTRSRGYVQVGGFALIGNAVVRLGHGFIGLSRWTQIGIIGSILLGLGLTALFKRDEVLAARSNMTEEWRKWNT